MTPEQLQMLIHERLTQALLPTVLEICDESHLHIGHPGAKSGGRHFKITIASAQFSNQNLLSCHRLVYTALGELIGKEIHAARIICA